MQKVISRDGTPIAYDRIGTGPALILVDGALCYRASGPLPKLATHLSTNFTVFTYDRRGRGESGDRSPYAIDREIEDLDAVLQSAGGSAHVCGVSSGAALALEAANHGLAIQKLALYEAPFIVDATRDPLPDDYLRRLNEFLAADRRSDAVKHFMRFVGVPGFVLALMPITPVWSKLKGVAHTLPYDITIVQDFERGQPLPGNRWTTAGMPTLVLDGGKSPEWMRNAMRSLAGVLPHAAYRTLPGQTHMVNAPVLAPVLTEFFKN